MKNIKKIIAIGLIASSISIIPVVGVNAEWRQDSNQKWWNTEGNSWSVGWKEINGKWYCFGQDGYMLQNTTTPDGFKVDNSGMWIQNITNTTTNTANTSTNVSNTANSNNSSNSNVNNTVDNSNSGNTTLNNTGSITYNDNSKTTNNVNVDNSSKEEKNYYKESKKSQEKSDSAMKAYYEKQLSQAKADLSEAQQKLENIKSQKTVQTYAKDSATGEWGFKYEVDIQKEKECEKDVAKEQANVEYYEKLVNQ